MVGLPACCPMPPLPAANAALPRCLARAVPRSFLSFSLSLRVRGHSAWDAGSAWDSAPGAALGQRWDSWEFYWEFITGYSSGNSTGNSSLGIHHWDHTDFTGTSLGLHGVNGTAHEQRWDSAALRTTLGGSAWENDCLETNCE